MNKISFFSKNEPQDPPKLVMLAIIILVLPVGQPLGGLLGDTVCVVEIDEK